MREGYGSIVVNRSRQVAAIGKQMAFLVLNEVKVTHPRVYGMI